MNNSWESAEYTLLEYEITERVKYKREEKILLLYYSGLLQQENYTKHGWQRDIVLNNRCCMRVANLLLLEVLLTIFIFWILKRTARTAHHLFTPSWRHCSILSRISTTFYMKENREIGAAIVTPQNANRPPMHSIHSHTLQSC